MSNAPVKEHLTFMNLPGLVPIPPQIDNFMIDLMMLC